MTAVLMTPPYLQFFDDDGAPLAGGKVYTYTATGTFSTLKATYTTAAGDIEQTNPIILDAAGRPTLGNGSIWLSGTYDFKVTDSLENIIETTLNVTAFNTLSDSADAYFESLSGNGSQTAFTTSEDLGTEEKAIFVWVDNGLAQNVTNGTFGSDTGWTKGAGWTIGAGVATAAGAISTALSQTSAYTLVAGQAYALVYTITRSAGGIIPSIGGQNGTERTASGTYREVIVAGASQILAFTGNGFTGTLDDISVTVADPKGYEIQNPANYTINGTALTFTTAPAAGTGNIYVSAPSLLVGGASSAAADAAASAADALASEQAAAAYSGQLVIESTTSLAIGTGSKVFTVLADLALNAGQFILIVSDANSANYMWGVIASYTGTTLTIAVSATGGSGTLADWTMYLTGERGATGATGSINDFTGVATAAVASGDYFVFQDISASNLTKKDTIAAIVLLAQNACYPIGSYYFNETSSTNPATLLGFGTWSAVVDKFIVAHGSTYISTGGAATVTLAEANLPSHFFYTLASTNTNTDPADPSAVNVTNSQQVAATNYNGGIGAESYSLYGTATSATVGKTNTIGSGTAFGIIPPYQAAYVWKRTA